MPMNIFQLTWSTLKKKILLPQGYALVNWKMYLHETADLYMVVHPCAFVYLRNHSLKNHDCECYRRLQWRLDVTMQTLRSSLHCLMYSHLLEQTTSSDVNHKSSSSQAVA